MSGAAWVLLVILYSAGGAQPTMWSALFWTRDTCEAARSWSEQRLGQTRQIEAECFLTGAALGTVNGKP